MTWAYLLESCLVTSLDGMAPLVRSFSLLLGTQVLPTWGGSQACVCLWTWGCVASTAVLSCLPWLQEGGHCPCHLLLLLEFPVIPASRTLTALASNWPQCCPLFLCHHTPGLSPEAALMLAATGQHVLFTSSLSSAPSVSLTPHPCPAEILSGNWPFLRTTVSWVPALWTLVSQHGDISRTEGVSSAELGNKQTWTRTYNNLGKR
jgi:hypothetical protein